MERLFRTVVVSYDDAGIKTPTIALEPTLIKYEPTFADKLKFLWLFWRLT